ncbi:hypothetical protein [Shinella zoogloeoides]|uniref:hypothetical protein n=1 Tax=Shinella zoogloeoides TaxID=352475 RepID=UPI001F5AD4A3|nr:hypothetical protein [Shinella zoogloeoides]
MPMFTVETAYRLPAYRTRTYEADTPELACRLAIEDDDRDGDAVAYESAGETYVTSIWPGPDAPLARSSIAVPSQFAETNARKIAQFEILLGLLKMLVADVCANAATQRDWIARASWEVARGEAIIAGARDPDPAADLPGRRHVLAWLEEDRVRDRIATILATDPDFGGLSPDAVTDSEISSACLAVVRSTAPDDRTGTAEIRAALTALGPALWRNTKGGRP